MLEHPAPSESQAPGDHSFADDKRRVLPVVALFVRGIAELDDEQILHSPAQHQGSTNRAVELGGPPKKRGKRPFMSLLGPQEHRVAKLAEIGACARGAKLVATQPAQLAEQLVTSKSTGRMIEKA